MLEQILGNREFIVRNYVDDTIRLVKSITLINDAEAKVYNAQVQETFSTHNVNTADKKSWRYFKHISGNLHATDGPLYIKSIDNLEQIELTRDSLLTHIKTREELLKFDRYYKDLITTYPTYELYIKAIITEQKYTLQELINLPNMQIVSYNATLTEEQELDVIDDLQARLNNYAVTWGLTFYSKSDTLFLASQISITYLFILTSILAIRLRNAKTNNAHSFHIKNYLASYHYLDEYYTYMDKEQRLFLYRNLLFINKHAGKNSTFNLLVDKLFTKRGIPLSTYDYYTTDTLDENRDPTYLFKKRYFSPGTDRREYKLDDIKSKENGIVAGNDQHWTIASEKTHTGLTYTLHNYLTSKDLETTLYDFTDNVKYKLLNTILDYTAYMCKNNINNFFIILTNASNTATYTISTNDSFKLLSLLLYRYNGHSITEFPDYTIKHVRRKVQPSSEFLLGKLYKKKYHYRKELEDILFHTEQYPQIIVSSYQFYNFVNKQYLTDIALWLYLSNKSDGDDEGQLSELIHEMYTDELYTLNTETVDSFIDRLSLQEINSYARDEILILFNKVLNLLFDNRYDELFNIKFIQKALIGIFNKFKSYTVQIIDEYSANDIVLTGAKDNRTSVGTDIHSFLYFMTLQKFSVQDLSVVKSGYDVNTSVNTIAGYFYKAELPISFITKIATNANIGIITPVKVYATVLKVIPPHYLVSQNTQENLLFLASSPV